MESAAVAAAAISGCGHRHRIAAGVPPLGRFITIGRPGLPRQTHIACSGREIKLLCGAVPGKRTGQASFTVRVRRHPHLATLSARLAPFPPWPRILTYVGAQSWLPLVFFVGALPAAARTASRGSSAACAVVGVFSRRSTRSRRWRAGRMRWPGRSKL